MAPWRFREGCFAAASLGVVLVSRGSEVVSLGSMAVS